MSDEIKEMNFSEMLFNRDERLLDYITNLQEENDRLNNIINELEKTLLEKIEAIKTIKDMLGEEAKIVNSHIEVLETEYKYFLDKLKELKEQKWQKQYLTG